MFNRIFAIGWSVGRPLFSRAGALASLLLFLVAGCAQGDGTLTDGFDGFADAAVSGDLVWDTLAKDLVADPGLPATDVADGQDAADVPSPGDNGADVSTPLTLAGIAPDRGSSNSMSTVTLTGTGFVDGMEVRFGGRRSPYVFVLGPGVANVTAPAGTPGTVDVSALRQDGAKAVLPNAFIYEAGLAIAAVQPPSGGPGGGTPIVIHGAGFLAGPVFLLGGREVVAVRVVDDATALGITPPHAPGSVTVFALAGDDQVSLGDGFLYLEETVKPQIPGMSVLSVVPAQGPAAGGTQVRILGTGFAPGASVRFGGLPATDVTVVSAEELRALTPQGSPGPVDVVVRVSVGETVLHHGFEYRPPAMTLLALEPDSGAWCGGTRVRIHGQGMAGVRRVFFGGVEATDVVVESSVSVVARAPRSEEAGPVMMMVLGDEGAFRERAFLYFDPVQRGGGTWGRSIGGDINVTVLSNQTGRGLPGAYVMLGADPHTPHQGMTDDRGQLTFASEEMRGPVAVHATTDGYTAASLAGFDARNATLYVGQVPSPEGTPGTPGTGTSPTCTVSGRILDYGKYLLKPPWAQGVPFGQCWTTAPSMFGSVPDPGPGQYVDSNGRFKLQVRLGRSGIVCALMVAPTGGGTPYPVRMGMAPRVSCTDRPVDGVEVALSIDTDADLWFASRGVPEHELGVNGPSLLGGWELLEDGFLPVLKRVERPRPDRLKVPWQPVDYEGVFAGAGHSIYQTVSARTPIGIPYAVTLSAGVQPPSTWPVVLVEPSGPVPLATLVPRAFTAMATAADGVLAADEGGATYWFDGVDFHAGAMRTGVPIRGLWGTAVDDFWAVGDKGRAWRVTGRDVVEVSTSVAVDLFGISGVVSGDVESVSIAAGPYLIRFEQGGPFFEKLPAGTRVRAVRRFDDGRIVAVGGGGAIAIGRAGEAFEVMRPTTQDLVAVDGISGDDFWALGSAGALVHWQGDDVTIGSLPGGREYAGLVLRGPCDVLAFGSEGTLFSFDCNAVTDLSRPDLRLDLLVGALGGGRPVLGGRHYVELPDFVGFPRIIAPVEGAVWDGRAVGWTLPGEQPVSYQQALLSGPTGYAFWIVTAGGDVREVGLPDFSRTIGYDPIPEGAKRMNLTVSRSGGFDIDGFTSSDLGYYRQEAFSVALGSFQ